MLGLWNGFLVAVLGIQPIIATLVLMTAGRGLAQLITDGQIITVANPLFAQLGGGFLLGLPVSVVLAAALFALVGAAHPAHRAGHAHRVGRGSTRAPARLAGVRARGITWPVYVFVALCAGIAGLMISSNVTAADANNAGLWIELDAILAVVIGGTLLTGGRYSIVGTLVGALVLQTLTTTVYTAGIPPEVTLVFKALVIIAVCLLQSPKTRALLRRRRPGPACPRRRWPRRERRQPPAPAGRRRSQRRRSPRPARRRARLAARCCPCWPRSCCSSPCSALGSARYDGFFSAPGAAQPVHRQRLPIVLAVGMTFVILTGGIDLSVGSVVALSGVLAAKLLATGWSAGAGDGSSCCSSAPRWASRWAW